MIHSARTVHGAGPNLSDRDRMAYVLIFDRVPTPAGDDPALPLARGTSHRAGAAGTGMAPARRTVGASLAAAITDAGDQRADTAVRHSAGRAGAVRKWC